MENVKQIEGLELRLTPLQFDRIINLINTKFLDNPKDNTFWLALQHNLEWQKRSQPTKNKLKIA